VKTITVDEAQTPLPDIIRQLADGGELIITQDHQPVARLIRISASKPTTRPGPPVTGIPKLWQYKGRFVVPDNFDEPLDELREYGRTGDVSRRVRALPGD